LLSPAALEVLVPTRLTAAARIRRFNRFYTRRMGLLNEGLLQSSFSLAEVRVLYEIAHLPQPTARVIASTLNLDEGHLSRLLRGLRQRGLVTARPAPGDRRQRRLALTTRGRKAFGALNARATEEVAEMLRDLSTTDQRHLLDSLGTVETLLGKTDVSDAPTMEIRGPEAGDLGWVVQRHGELYAEEYGWTVEFERLVAGIVGEFASAPSDSGNRCWIATVNGEQAGCVFLVPVSPELARLRLLLVEPWARGLGLGTRLVQECIAAAREDGYRTLTLWTNDVLTAARRLYERAGFRLVKSERHHSFGKSLVGQNWELELLAEPIAVPRSHSAPAIARPPSTARLR
jgi:DNA-binding MarR family transcriptional regulator/N-acetylglutamate synthase-like GNAT family acetyltransferase